MERLESHPARFEPLDLSAHDGPQLLRRLARWVAIGWRDTELVRSALQRLPQDSRSSLTLRDYAEIRMAEGMIAMSSGNLDEALARFNAVLTLSENIDDRKIVAIANLEGALPAKAREMTPRSCTPLLQDPRHPGAAAIEWPP